MNVTVLTGGSTPERDVALAGAGQVVHALRARGHHTTVVDTVSGALTPQEESVTLGTVATAPPDLETLADLRDRELGPRLLELPAVQQADVLFLVLHGRDAEGGTLQAMLDMAGIPYTGSDVLGSAVAMDKDMAKRLFRTADVPTPDWQMWPASRPEVERLGLPLIVKPSRVGSTVGLTVVHDLSDLDHAVEVARQYDDDILLEAFVDGPELTVGILDGEALAVGEIRPQHAIFDYECKYTPGMCEELFPAPIDAKLVSRIQALGVRAHMALKLRDYSRVDFRVNMDGDVFCLEANTLPGLTRTSLLPQSAAATGLDFETLCDRIVQGAWTRKSGTNAVTPGFN